jgi:hypothetical protein
LDSLLAATVKAISWRCCQDKYDELPQCAK